MYFVLVILRAGPSFELPKPVLILVTNLILNIKIETSKSNFFFFYAKSRLYRAFSLNYIEIKSTSDFVIVSFHCLIFLL